MPKLSVVYLLEFKLILIIKKILNARFGEVSSYRIFSIFFKS